MRYRVRALSTDGLVNVELDAVDEAAAAELARVRALVVLAVQPVRVRVRRRGSFSLTLFTQELLALLRAGLGLIESIQALADRQSAGRDTLLRVIDQLRSGRALSDALSDHPGVFPALYVETVRAAERTGALAEALGRYVVYDRQVEDVRQQLVSALIYPALLLGVGSLVTLFLLGYVVPRFSGIYAELGRDMPWASSMLFHAGAAIDRNPWTAAGVLAVVVAGALGAWRSVAIRARLARALQRAPLIGARLTTFRIARLYRTLGMLLRGGVPLVPAMRMVAGMLGQEAKERLDAARHEVSQGMALSGVLERHGLTTQIGLRMLQVGERGGDLAGAMEQAAAFHEEELAQWVQRSTRLFEPLLMMLIGIMIGGIVVLMYLPIFELAGSLQ